MNLMNNTLVSMIIPCYNGEKYLKAFLNSIVKQTYKNLEIFFVNDGSNDNTENIFLKWQAEHEKLFNSVHYFYQENSGQASAINSVLNKINGKYLVWCDIDDLLYPTNIEDKLKEMLKDEKLDLVFSACRNVNENGKQLSVYRRKQPIENLFYDFIFERNVHFCPAIYMVKVDSVFKYYPERSIYINNGGQNWQLLLPSSYNGNIKYIDKVLVDYLVRLDSHSKKLSTIYEIFRRLDEHKEILLNTLEKIKVDNERDLFNQIDIKYNQLKFNFSLKKNSKKNVRKYYYELSFSWKNLILYILYKVKLFKFIYKVVSLLKNN